MNSSFVSIVEIHLSLQHKASECGIQAINIHGKSVLNSIKSNCMEIYYNSIDNTTNVTNELYMENYQIENTANTNKVIKIYLLEFLEDVKIFLHKTTFSGIKVVAFGLFCSGFQGQSIINITECNFLDMQFKTTVIQFKLNDCYNRLGNQSEIYLSHCKFSNNTFQNEKGALVYFQIYEMNEDPWLHIRESLMIFIIDCTFHNNHNLIIIVVRFRRNDFGHIAAPIVMIKNIEISDLKLAKNSYAMYFYDVEVYLKGSVVLKYIKSSNDRSAIIKSIGYLQFEKYFEISNSVVEIAFNTSCVYIAEYSVVNFTANIIDTLISNKESFLSNAESFISSPKILMPCIFQYSSNRGNLDREFQTNECLNYFILLNSNNIRRLSYYKYGIMHCGWHKDSAYTTSNPRFVNQRIMHYLNEPQKQIRKDICLCGPNGVHGSCFEDELGPFYPRQTVELNFIISNVPTLFEIY